MTNQIYLSFHNKIFDKIIKKKRLEILNIIKMELEKIEVFDCLDVGTTPDIQNESSNFIIKNLKLSLNYKAFSNLKIADSFFSLSKIGSITDNFDNESIKNLKSDLVLASATIEHVGSHENQKKMIKNISLLTSKIFFITTPNKNYPIDFHSKLPLVNMLPNNIFRKILKFLNFDYLSREENLNLLTQKDIKQFLHENNLYENFEIKIKYIKLFCLKSNFIIIGIKKS